ncbi:hypothetical protein NP233_g13040 [Leucocoprinus birnbaumii]|uniref:Uncharacterized protein n=1 Tax=Leucocoprinus birnbaumii TaxID=56174 RepID=A0AAD5VFC1_9AGAR|nr:hypothetical protein NP233_g13040 [Leucocoprinus birnbaumii]
MESASLSPPLLSQSGSLVNANLYTRQYPASNSAPLALSSPPSPTGAELSLPLGSGATIASFPSALMVPASSPDAEHPRTIVLANGTWLSFCSSDIPSLPSVSFASDIPWLGRIWDDARPEWDPSGSILSIKGEAIALKHWPDVYRHDTHCRWKKIKKFWTEWRFLAIRWLKASPDDFWNEFSVDGLPLSYTNILQRLREQRKTKDAGDAWDARAESGGQFSSEYCYSKGSRGSISLSSNTAIAKRYRMRQQARGVTELD